VHEQDEIDRLFWSRINRTDTCWIWMGPIFLDGFGKVYLRNKTCASH
jgi:hypothetical protein